MIEIRGQQILGFVNCEALYGTVPPRHHDFDSIRLESDKIPEVRGSLMGGEGRLAGCSDGNHDSLFPTWWASSDQQRSSLGSCQSTSRNEPLHLMIGKANAACLVKRDDAVLLLGGSSQSAIGIHDDTMSAGYDVSGPPSEIA
jgi:hypothetical protein